MSRYDAGVRAWADERGYSWLDVAPRASLVPTGQRIFTSKAPSAPTRDSVLASAGWLCPGSYEGAA